MDREAAMGQQAPMARQAALRHGERPARLPTASVGDDVAGAAAPDPLRRGGQGAAAGQAGVLLGLQRTHGNQAVQRLLTRLRAEDAARTAPLLATRRSRGPSQPAATGMVARAGGAAIVQRALIDDFGKSFPDSAAIVKKSPEALKLVKEAEAAGSKFGGFAEDGPGKSAWPYTIGDTVYVPKAHTDKVVAMSDFLFELNNAIRSPAFAKIHAEGAKGSKGSLSAKDYAYKKVEQEVEGMLRLGKVWFETKKTMGGGKELDKYDAENYLQEYNDFNGGKKTKDDIIKSVLGRVYPEGEAKGKTVEQFYMEQYAEISGGK
jgi:hypothetical protein